jgi:Tfp pilus assembly protein PilO
MSNSKSLFGAFVLAAAMFTVWPGVFGAYNKVQALREAKTAREQLLAERTELLTAASTEYSKYAAATAGESGRAFLALVPVGRDGAELLSALADMATRADVALSQVSVSEVKQAKDQAYQTTTIRAELTGSYSGLRTFLASLEQYVRILNVQSLDVSREATSGLLRFSLQADAYFIK